jgi:glutaredoxin-like protein
MEILTEEVREATRAKLAADMVGGVTLVLFTQESSPLILPNALPDQECLFCNETRRLLEEVISLSPKLKLEVHDFKADTDKVREFNVDKVPALALIPDSGQDNGIRFFGVPSGYEYTSLVEAIVDVSRGRSGLSDRSRERLKALDRDIHLQVFVTPACPYCTIAVRLSHQFALESQRVKADMVESTEFPQLSARYQVMAVPRTVVNDTRAIEGAMPEEKFLDEILGANAAPER